MRSVRARCFSALLLAIFPIPLLQAQYGGQAPYGLEPGQAAPLQISGQFQATRANAPPGQCGCFWMEGGGIEIHRAFRSDWGALIDVSYTRNGQINGTDETLGVLNYLFGPRYTYRTTTRYTPFGQVLAGASHVTSNYYVYQSDNTYLAVEAGAGVEMYVKPRLAAVPLEVNWVHSQALNGVNKRQNNLRVGVGVVYRFGPH